MALLLNIINYFRVQKPSDKNVIASEWRQMPYFREATACQTVLVVTVANHFDNRVWQRFMKTRTIFLQ